MSTASNITNYLCKKILRRKILTVLISTNINVEKHCLSFQIKSRLSEGFRLQAVIEITFDDDGHVIMWRTPRTRKYGAK